MIPVSIRIVSSSMDEEQDDFRPVPSSDTGEKYRDRGMLGSYSPSEDPFSNPADVRFEDGFGADVSDLKRGYCDPLITSDPAYDLQNYKDRSSSPRVPDIDFGNQDAVESDFEFRNRNRKAQGFLTRPRVPTERG